ncbi:hypothetical protein BDA96_01G115100 [Sorghum bicolor]|uniref:Uncharacterized protein n=2 Tax=Sorghum bicolor TaxID=4558 RepID=A0A921RYC5_SORBI|nr:hypothetical protein BDA96_03G151300 [Sorghum bicolor]KAG0547845.1 hypothetical protein BDA96_01G115100 [Sorghum bicolor]KXG37695.1 hypothetical protein SORBI_3001G110800 [Sorghum bicolor]
MSSAIRTSTQEEGRRGHGHRTTGAIRCSPFSSSQGVDLICNGKSKSLHQVMGGCGKKFMKDELVFKPKEDMRSHGVLDVGFCKMEVTVAWSLISYHPVPLNVY